MNANKVLFTISFVIFGMLTWFCLPSRGDSNSTVVNPAKPAATTTTQKNKVSGEPNTAPAQRSTSLPQNNNTPATSATRPTIVYTYPPNAYPPNFYSPAQTNTQNQNQPSIDQQTAAVQQELDTLRAEVRALSDKGSKQDANDPLIGQRLNRIEQLLGNINVRLKNLEQRVDQQAVKIRKLKTDQDAAQTVRDKDPNNANKFSTKN